MKLHRLVTVLGVCLLALLAGPLALADSALADGTNVLSSPDTVGNVGVDTSLELDSEGNPVISYYDVTNSQLKVMHCNDPQCVGGNEDVDVSNFGSSGQYTSLELDANDCPWVSHYRADTGDLRMYAQSTAFDPCDVSVDTEVDTSGDVGQYTSLELDANGNPVISYYDATNYDLKVFSCITSCASPSWTTPDFGSLNAAVGLYTSLELDQDGNPVVSYYQEDLITGLGDLRIMHCNDPNCAGGDESRTEPDTAAADLGQYTSLELTSDGNPVVSYYDATHGDVKLMICNDPNCAGNDESVGTVDGALGDDVGRNTSLELDANDRPVVSYRDNTNLQLKIMVCRTPQCSDRVIVAPDPTVNSHGVNSSLKLDAYQRPVVSYRDSTNANLKLLRCGVHDCGVAFVDSDLDGCPDSAEEQTAVGSELTGGRRDPKNPWDYFNPSKDGQNRIDDILAVVAMYFIDKGNQLYTNATDRTLPVDAADDWNLGPPNGQHRVDDILHAVNQYFHDC